MGESIKLYNIYRITTIKDVRFKILYMKFKKIKTLNEAVADVSDINYSVVNHTYANAIR